MGGREGNGGTRGRGDQAERERKETWGEGEVEVEKPREMCPDCAGEATGKQVKELQKQHEGEGNLPSMVCSSTVKDWKDNTVLYAAVVCI